MRDRRPVRALASLGAATLAAASLVVLGTATAPASAATTPGTPWTWGENTYGQLGDGSTTTRLSAAKVNGLTDVTDLHGGREHVVALRSDGTVWVWGSNVEGQLGLGTTSNVSVPTRVPSLSGVVAVETGHNYTMALKSDGTVWASGLNSDGQLGDGTTTLRRTPVKVAGVTDAVAIAGGRDMSYAIRANGQLVGWGRNDEGQLGDGTLTRRLAPVRVGSLAGVVRVAGGRDHGLAVLGDGSAWAWGQNDFGQVGDGTLTDRTVPVRVVTSGIADVAAGAHHSYGLRGDGTVASWGRNYRSELGDGTTTQRTRPVNVLGVSGATTLGTGRDMGVVTLADGRVKAWGHNAYGQLGDGTKIDRTSAVFVPGITNAVKSAGGGSAFGVVLVGDAAPPANQAPTARITGSCTDLACPLSGSTSSDADGTIAGYAWDFGDGAKTTGPSPGHTYTAAGTYTVTLTVTDDDGATGTTSRQVTVSEAPPPANQPPVARITDVSCADLTCSFSGSTSSDPDGTVVAYAWTSGDPAQNGTGATYSVTFASAGPRTVSLQVTDDDGATHATSVQVSPGTVAQPDPVFATSASSDANTTSASVVVPAATPVSSRLVLVATTNTAATHTTPAGWTLLGSVVDGAELRSSVYTRTAVAGVPGSTVRLAVSALSKTSLSLLAYDHADPVTAVASTVQGSAVVAAHPAPATTVGRSGSTVLRYWVDKGSTVRAWTTPAGVTRRTSTAGTGGGMLNAVTADADHVAAGPVPASSATSSVASDKAIGWTIVVPHTAP
jgi:alpha-tubulin suppressor-like RCC1 family protein